MRRMTGHILLDHRIPELKIF